MRSSDCSSDVCSCDLGAVALFGIGIALWRSWNSLRASSRAVDQLMDKEWPLERRQRFIETAGHHPRISGIHDLRTRTSGMHDFAQFHIWVSPQMTVREAHRVMDEKIGRASCRESVCQYV